MKKIFLALAAILSTPAFAYLTPIGGGGGGSVNAVTGSAPIASSGGTNPDISIALAAADGVTKGAAAFTASDFNASSGVVSIDYTNGQAASASLKGFLTAADWSSFDGKQNALGFTPVNKAGDTIDDGSAIASVNTINRTLLGVDGVRTVITWDDGVGNLIFSPAAITNVNSELGMGGNNITNVNTISNGSLYWKIDSVGNGYLSGGGITWDGAGNWGTTQSISANDGLGDYAKLQTTAGYASVFYNTNASGLGFQLYDDVLAMPTLNIDSGGVWHFTGNTAQIDNSGNGYFNSINPSATGPGYIVLNSGGLSYLDGSWIHNRSGGSDNFVGQVTMSGGAAVNNIVDAGSGTVTITSADISHVASNNINLVADQATSGGMVKIVGAGLKLENYTSVVSPVEGELAWDYTNHKQMVYTGSGWSTVTSVP